MKDVKLTIVRAGSGLFALIALITGARLIYVGAKGAFGEAAAKLADSSSLAALDNDLRFLAMCCAG